MKSETSSALFGRFIQSDLTEAEFKHHRSDKPEDFGLRVLFQTNYAETCWTCLSFKDIYKTLNSSRIYILCSWIELKQQMNAAKWSLALKKKSESALLNKQYVVI